LYVEIQSRPLVFRGREARIVLARDVTEYYLHERELVEQSLRDPLTGCRNRRYLEQYAGDATETERWGCIMLDVDGLKQVNDNQGHAHGDEALIAVARALARHAGEEDVVVRMGGDEFLLLLKNSDEGAVRGIADRLTAASASLPAGFSLGYAARVDQENIYDTLRRADVELYRMRARNKDKTAASNGQPISSPES
jgi:diguanylate cyclase (GGDEF)-like protein